MIEIVAIAWACVATVGGITAGIAWIKAADYADDLDQKGYVQYLIAADRLRSLNKARAQATDAEDRLRAIELKRHLAAKAGRAAQIAAHKAKVAETTQKLRAVS